MTTLSDNFDRADSNPISNSAAGWSWISGGSGVDNTMRIVSNEASFLRNGASNYVSVAEAQSDLASADHYAECTANATVSASSYSGPGVRVTKSPKNGYFFRRLQDGSSGVVKIVSETLTTLLTGPTGLTSTDVLRISVSGSTIRAYVNGVEISGSPITDSDVASGLRAGAVAFPQNGNDRAKIDNWVAADLAAATTAPPPRRRYARHMPLLVR